MTVDKNRRSTNGQDGGTEGKTETPLHQDCGTAGNCVCLITVQCRVIVDNKCECQHFHSYGCAFSSQSSPETVPPESSRSWTVTNIYKSFTWALTSSIVSIDRFAVITVVGRRDKN